MPSEPEPRNLSIAEAIREGTAEAMRENESVILYGLGVNDPGRVFGTTAGLVEEFGKERVFEVPTSENALTGIAVGAALGGLRPIVTHQRADFFYLAMDQLVNSAAKWRYMYGGQFTVPLVFRLIVGKGWGQGPTHSQTMHSWLVNVPGLKVVCPSNSSDAKRLMKASIEDDNPVVFIEDRSIHGEVSKVLADDRRTVLGKARVARDGVDVSIFAVGALVPEALKAAHALDAAGVSSEVIDLRTVKPIDLDALLVSVDKTRGFLVLDNAHSSGSFGENLVGRINSARPSRSGGFFRLLAWPDFPQPTSAGAMSTYYPDKQKIFSEVIEAFGLEGSKESEAGRIALGEAAQKDYAGPF